MSRYQKLQILRAENMERRIEQETNIGMYAGLFLGMLITVWSFV